MKTELIVKKLIKNKRLTLEDGLPEEAERRQFLNFMLAPKTLQERSYLYYFYRKGKNKKRPKRVRKVKRKVFSFLQIKKPNACMQIKKVEGVIKILAPKLFK